MKFKLSEKEIGLLKDKSIPFDSARDYTDDEALDFLEQVRDIEVEYAQDYDTDGEKLYFQYGDLADKIQSQIPED